MSVNEFEKLAIERVKAMWHLYLVDRTPDEVIASFATVPENIVVLGTGRHEFYRGRDEYISSFTSEQIEVRDIRFNLIDEWYEVQTITPEVCVVYGSIWVREIPEPGRSIIVDMEGSRFSAVCLKKDDDVVICNVHHSMPYFEQIDNEYYPKTLSAVANEAVVKNEILEHRLQLDHMTEIYNRVYMEKYLNNALSEEDGYFFLMDLDDFKLINDTKGHLMGDEVILAFASAMKEVFPSNALIARMGGDEFAAWDSSIKSDAEAEEIFNKIKISFNKLSKNIEMPLSFSMGIAFCEKGHETFTEVYKRSDIALYDCKAMDKDTFAWAKPNNLRKKAKM